MIFIGDIHGEWSKLAKLLGYKGMRDATLVSLGDFGLGFPIGGRGGEEGRLLEARLLDRLGSVLRGRGCDLHVLRGNHDDPAYFDGLPDRERRMTFHRDYTLLSAEGSNVLMIGGAISVDRSARVEGESWWPGERLLFDGDALDAALRGIDTLDIVATHTAPDFAFPENKLVGGHAGWLTADPTLESDLREERAILTRIHALLLARGLRPAHWLYGHFHQSHREEIDGTSFICLNELRMMRL